MEFSVIIECTCCNTRTNCNEEIAIVNGQQKMMNFCKDCYEEIKGVKCPKCDSTNTFKREENSKSTLYKCKDCWLVFDES
jgi:hypothetical protein